MKIVINELIDQLISMQQGQNWIGINYEKVLNTLADDLFFHKPNGGNSIAEIIAHLTVWRKETILKINTAQGSITDEHPSNWQDIDALKTTGKTQLIKNYNESLSRMIALLQGKNDDFLDSEYYDTDFKGYYPYLFLIRGMLHHDTYHLGQINHIIKNYDSV